MFIQRLTLEFFWFSKIWDRYGVKCGIFLEVTYHFGLVEICFSLSTMKLKYSYLYTI